ncbi:hypothetical protein B0J18DRAFT_438799 [Chaetomium sp. MPI-SDFR-AT-0129]|nr:hypothetical protein B0J18DRAFT_438799 [Chaetomium sp. MPI-SDFR-AT-0129]
MTFEQGSSPGGKRKQGDWQALGFDHANIGTMPTTCARRSAARTRIQTQGTAPNQISGWLQVLTTRTDGRTILYCGETRGRQCFRRGPCAVSCSPSLPDASRGPFLHYPSSAAVASSLIEVTTACANAVTNCSGMPPDSSLVTIFLGRNAGATISATAIPPLCGAGNKNAIEIWDGFKRMVRRGTRKMNSISSERRTKFLRT